MGGLERSSDELTRLDSCLPETRKTSGRTRSPLFRRDFDDCSFCSQIPDVSHYMGGWLQRRFRPNGESRCSQSSIPCSLSDPIITRSWIHYDLLRLFDQLQEAFDEIAFTLEAGASNVEEWGYEALIVDLRPKRASAVDLLKTGFRTPKAKVDECSLKNYVEDYCRLYQPYNIGEDWH